MAAASPSPLVSSVEKTNGAKLSRLLIDGGTMVLRKIFDRYHPPANLLTNLNVNYHALNNLLRRRVLHKPQWDLLFPPGGAMPDSNTFDITLLFLLLTNICGLSPPPSGWHTKPLLSDTSVEANLARIKFFRNELYGHVTTTGLDTPTFSALWLEISAVLVAIGLPQADINRLRAEHCGEEDFLDVLFEWAESEDDIMSQLKEIRQYQSKVQLDVGEVHLTQREDRKILQGNKRKLGEVYEALTEAQQTVDEVRHSQTKTQQTVDEVRQSQLEDRETIQNSNIQLQEVIQMDTKTHQLVRNVRETQIDDSKAIQEIRHTQYKFQKTLQETKSKVDKLQQTQEKPCLAGQDFKETAEGLQGQRERHRENEILKKLAQIDNLKNIRHYADRYVEGTRLSVFAKVESWLDDRSSPNRVMVISGNAGMGKSVIAAVMCEKMQEAGRLAGSHFCQHDRARHRNPKVMIQSLASQLCDFLPDYKNVLVEKLSRNLGVEINNMEVKDLFEVLFEEPLTSLNDPGLTYLMVIDGLDESEFQGRNELLDVIANYFQGLPLWIRFLVTTRPEINIAETLKNLHPLQLDPNVGKNVKDIYLCFEKQTGHLLQSEHREIILNELVQKSEGVMLYAHYLVDFINTKVSLVTPELLDSILPSGISSIYHSYFKRLETELLNELRVTKGQFLNFLHALSAAREPLPLSFVSRLLLPVKSTSVTQGEVNDAISCVSALLPVQDECIHFFHKSVKDWLIENSNYRHDLFIKKGHEVLSELCIDELDDVKRKGVTCAKFSDTSRYALRHGVQHMLQVEDARVSLEEVVKKFVLDLELVYAKLCVNVTLAFEDVICVQKHTDIEKYHEALTTLMVLLRKHIATLEKHPHTIFQTLLNEGGPEFSSEATHFLDTKYSEIAYMEYLHKEDLQGRVQAKFDCSAAVTCFDVSPQLDYMVCECNDGAIQLWSLHTGKQLWKRDVKLPKGNNYSLSPFSIGEPNEAVNYNDWLLTPFKPSYRSVVFHPTEDLVLPGILSHAYTFDGDLKPLFLSSKCRFWNCSISAEKTKMLTDCPNNANSITMWSLKDGSEINRFTWSDDIVSFAWSCNGRLLAISDLFGSLTLVDVMDGYKALAQTTISVSGMIKFSPDCRCLYSLVVFNRGGWRLSRIHVNMENDDDFSLHVLRNEVSYHPWEFESCSETGFLLGDPFCLPSGGDTVNSREPSLAFVLNGKSVLTVTFGSSTIEMLQHDELTRDIDEVSKTTVRNVALSLSGDTLFAITETDDGPATLMGWDITSGMFKPVTRAFKLNDSYAPNLVAVRDGVLLWSNVDCTRELWSSIRCTREVLSDFECTLEELLSNCGCTLEELLSNCGCTLEELLSNCGCTLELWNFKLSECIRSWTDFKCPISKVIPISEERVAFGEEGKVTIVDTTREGIVSTTTIEGDLVACSSKCHVITTHHRELQAQCGDKVLWKMSNPFYDHTVCVTFSPSEQYCVFVIDRKLYILDVSGKTLRTLQHRTHNRRIPEASDFTFVSDEECVALFSDEFLRHFLQLFNVKSGDLLSEITLERPVFRLAACPRERLIAIGLNDSKVNFKVLRVKLPGDKHSRKSKRIKLKR